ncbi:MAG: OmpA family protein [Cytophagales bacterium]|nr:OmpA family protein [Cytophagales bacterium]
MNKTFICYPLLSACLFWSFLLGAQEKRTVTKRIRTDSVTEQITLNIYDFEFINNYSDYFNEAKMKEILKKQEAEEWETVYNLINDYVGRFGIQNFYKDTKMIWRLAKLTEMFGDREKAKSLYRLVLRHHHRGINIREVELYYDSLNRQEAQQYVPLDYYYEMAEHRKLIDTLRPPRGVLLNMGATVNSSRADYGPSLNILNDVLIFTSKRNTSGVSFDPKENEDIFISRRDDFGWGPAKELTGLNTRDNEGSATLSREGKSLFFSRCDCSDCFGDCDLFVTNLLPDSTWSDAINLGPEVNSVSWDSHPALSHTGDTLYFASDRLGGFGLSDLYFTYRKEDSTWARSQNMGPVINTRNNDVSPFYHPVFDVLYFSSNGQLYNFGEFDIYKSYKEGGKWAEPYNIGPLVNGLGSEFYFTIDSESVLLFYSRSTDRDLNKLDLYSFPLPMEAQPLATIPVSGTLTDSLTGKPFTGIVSIIDLDEGVEVAPKFLKPDGSFNFDLINNRNYLLVIQGDDFFRLEEVFYLDGPLEINKVTEPLASKVKFESIEFNVGKFDLKEEMYADLNKIVNFLYDNAAFKLRISGHTDSFGSDEVNLRLSKERAKSIYSYVVDFAGIQTDRVIWEGFGSSRPIILSELTEADKRVNRRVEFEIYREGVVEEVED